MEQITVTPNYERLYHALFNKITDEIYRLQKIQSELEDMYISQTTTIIVPNFKKIDKKWRI